MPRPVRFGLIIGTAALLVACASSQVPMGVPLQHGIAPNAVSENVLHSPAAAMEHILRSPQS